MNLRIALIIVAYVLPLLGGCQQRQASKQMQTELRFQEDRIYQLEDWIRQYNEQLNACRAENTSLSSGKPAAATPKKAPLRISPFGDSEPKTPDIPEVEIPKVEIPPVEIPPTELPAPNPKAPAGNRGARRTTPNTGARSARRPPTGSPSTASGVRKPPVGAVAPAVALAAVHDEEEPSQIKLSSYEAATPQDSGIAGITLNPLLTVPVNRDGQPGDDGLMVVVEPRNHAGDLIPPAGELSVSLIDRAGESEAEAYVGRWHYSAAETARLYRRTTLGDGIQLNLAWQELKPTHSRLELYVRLKTPDGRKLETKRLLDVALIPVSETAPVEPQRLQPEAEHVEPILKTPESQVDSKPPVVKVEIPVPKSDLFEVRPISESDAPQNEKTASTQPAPTPLVESLKPLTATAVRPPTVVAEPRVAAAPTPVRSTPPAAPRPRKPLPVHPPAEEQVAIPVEPGTAAEAPSGAAEPAPAQPRPQWAPYRKQK